jgi:nicotinamide-nucleotide amidase
MPIKAELITIGDEILYGQTLDTNSHWMSAELDKIGIKVIRKTTVGDVAQEILDAFKDAEGRADIILITGGLGPTKDDLTKPLISKYFDSPLVMNQDALKDVEAIFHKSGRTVSDINRKQAEIPEAAIKITNSLGTAPGMWIERNGHVFVAMPGVPFEMRRMMSDSILPKLKEKFVHQVIHHQVIRTVGIGESNLAELIAVWEDNLPSHIKLAYLPTLSMVKLRLTAIGSYLSDLKLECEALVEEIKPIIDKYVHSYEDQEIESSIGKMLLKAEKTIAFAESCTGGYLSHLITKVPGSSRYFLGSIISYSYEVKESELDVDHKVLEEKGAVSEEVVMQMAIAVRKKLKSDIGVSISGIAGPDGGTPEKPVGTVWIAYSDANKTVAKKLILTKDRVLNIQYSAYAALNMLRINFLEID